MPVKAPWWLAYVGLAALSLGIVFQAGIEDQRINDLASRVAALESGAHERTTKIGEIDSRTTGMDAKLSIIYDSVKGKK